MHDYASIPTPTATPRRKGVPGWLIALCVAIPLAAIVAVGIFALWSYSHKLHTMQKDVFILLVTSGNTGKVKQSLDANPSLVNAVGALGISPLGAAASSGDLAMMQLLIARKADVNGRAHAGFTPLHEAAVSNKTEAVTLLLAKGATIDAPTDTGCTPLNYAAIMGQTEVAEVLVAHGANVNAKTNDGSTPLKNARKQLAKLKQLPPNVIKARKAQMEQDIKQGRPIYKWPTSERYQKVIDFLRQHGGKE